MKTSFLLKIVNPILAVVFLYNRHYLWIFFALLIPQTVLGDSDLTDAEKKEIVYEMYEGYKKEFPLVKDISPRQAMKQMETGHVLFIDTRKPLEMKVSMLPGAMSKEAFLKDASKYKGWTIIAYCTISYRSGNFAVKMSNKGIDIYNLKGGLLAWVLEGGRIYDATGETKRVHVYGKKWNYLPRGYEAVFFSFFEK
ncbi:MAG: rhodanese-like domain-containing protein [Deltaproteobacteria bacterium]|nr:rhodanese-like domain-containing protein [Deltaproteobacteria bacterium]